MLCLLDWKSGVDHLIDIQPDLLYAATSFLGIHGP
jgi:hypothetical protein